VRDFRGFWGILGVFGEGLVIVGVFGFRRGFWGFVGGASRIESGFCGKECRLGLELGDVFGLWGLGRSRVDLVRRWEKGEILGVGWKEMREV
jgi:hypothetical protein